MVIATQNPIEMEGTYALPEAQRDRFMVRLSMGYPVESAEIAMLSARDRVSPLEELEPVTDAAEVRKLIEVTDGVHVSDGGAAVRRRAGHRDPPLPRPPARRLAARDAAPGPRGEGVGRDAGPRVRPARRRARPGAAGASRTGCCPTMEATMSGRRTDRGGAAGAGPGAGPRRSARPDPDGREVVIACGT